MTTTGRPFRANATGQRGAQPRWYDSASVVDDGMLRGRISSGRQFPLDQLTAVRALMLDVGDPVWACGPTAAALHGFDGFHLRPPFHLLIERGRNVARIGHVIHTTMVLEPIDREVAFGLPATAPARTIIDLVRTDDGKRVTVALDSSLRDGGTTETHLHRRIAALRTKGRHGIPELLRIIERNELARGGHSWLERYFLELVGAARLPRPDVQQVLTRAKDRLVRVDCRFPGTPLVVEILGYKFHRTREQMTRDAERMNRLLLDGYIVLQFTYTHLTEQSAWVIEQLREALGRLTGFCPTTKAIGKPLL